jgi:hypothetical protein
VAAAAGTLGPAWNDKAKCLLAQTLSDLGERHTVVLQPISVTLYDIFGYLVPGAVTVLALIIAAWTATAPRATLQLVPQPTQLWLALAFVAYIAGHVVQAISNELRRLIRSAENKVLTGDGVAVIPQCLADAARQKLGSRLGVPPDKLAPECVCAACDETVAQLGVNDDRQMYIYREGFYSWMAVACLLLSFASVARALVPGGAIRLAGTVHFATQDQWAVLAGLSALVACLMFRRYQRFAMYRVTRAILGFLALDTKEASPGKAGQ